MQALTIPVVKAESVVRLLVFVEVDVGISCKGTGSSCFICVVGDQAGVSTSLIQSQSEHDGLVLCAHVVVIVKHESRDLRVRGVIVTKQDRSGYTHRR